MDVKIEKPVYGGKGLARVDGQVVLVPFVLPGESIEIATERVNTGLLRGRPLRIIEPSPQRVVARCEYFANCGGCQYQHIEYSFQLEQKREVLRETLQRTGGIVFDCEIDVLSGEPWFYRNRIQLHFHEGAVGFHKAKSRDLCAVDHCYISSPTLNDVIRKLQVAVKEPQWPSFLQSLEVFTNETQVQFTVVDSARPLAARFFEWCASFIPGWVRGAIEYTAAGHVYQVSRGSFFQVNCFLTDALVAEVLRDSSGKHAADLYAGVGLFSLPLAQRFDIVDAVERGGAAFRDLEQNAQRGAREIRTIRAPAEHFLRTLTEAPDLIVADPPRAGLGNEATAELLRIKAPKLTLVSCDPATLARDMKKLLSNYRIERLTLVDLFPQTYHFEVVAHLTL
ncbi:MAG: class I SAM-dependent RNA methyltransferase [Acidobacteriaceae bacterium]|nr:class I SAM-dependent RNA methyltransferase [Acidobacteriaceae bacterium]